jgi:hypothetical protein
MATPFMNGVRKRVAIHEHDMLTYGVEHILYNCIGAFQRNALCRTAALLLQRMKSIGLSTLYGGQGWDPRRKLDRGIYSGAR